MGSAVAERVGDAPIGEEARQPGTASVRYGDADLLIARGECWRETEHGAYIIRSTEWDVFAEGSTFDDALECFIERTFEYAVLLGDLIEGGSATQEEHAAFDVLGPRLMRAIEAMKEFRRPRLIRRGRRSREWRRISPQQPSTLLSHA